MIFECIFQTPTIIPHTTEAKMEDFNLSSVCCLHHKFLIKVKSLQILESLIIYKQDGSTTACYNRSQTIDHMAFLVVCTSHKNQFMKRLHTDNK